MKTQEQIKAQFEKVAKEFFSFAEDYIEFMTPENQAEYLNDPTNPIPHVEPTEENIRAKVLDYLPFAWDKANNCRGLSAGRSLSHFYNWLWLIDHPLINQLNWDEYDCYGKYYLAKISEAFNFPWREHDNDRWANDESSEGQTADQYLAGVL